MAKLKSGFSENYFTNLDKALEGTKNKESDNNETVISRLENDKEFIEYVQRLQEKGRKDHIRGYYQGKDIPITN